MYLANNNNLNTSYDLFSQEFPLENPLNPLFPRICSEYFQNIFLLRHPLEHRLSYIAFTGWHEQQGTFAFDPISFIDPNNNAPLRIVSKCQQFKNRNNVRFSFFF